MFDHMAEALKRHIGKIKPKGSVEGDSDDESLKGSQKGPGEVDHAPSLDAKSEHESSGVEELRNPMAETPGHAGSAWAVKNEPTAAPGGAHLGLGHGMENLGPEHIAMLHSIAQGGHMTGSPKGLEARGSDKAKEMYASIQKKKEGSGK